MRRLTAMLFALMMIFAIGCEPPAADDGGDDTDANTTMTQPVDRDGVQLARL